MLRVAPAGRASRANRSTMGPALGPGAIMPGLLRRSGGSYVRGVIGVPRRAADTARLLLSYGMRYWAGGMRWSSTLAEHKTPGTPAPGWAAAPTK